MGQGKVRQEILAPADVAAGPVARRWRRSGRRWRKRPQRAVIGWEEPVFHAGTLVGYRRRYSDALLALLINRGLDPAAKAKVARGEDAISEALLARLEGMAAAEDRRREQATAAAIAAGIAAAGDDERPAPRDIIARGR